MTQINSPAELEEVRQEILSRRGPDMPCISICAGAGCMAFGAGEVIAAFKAEIEKQGLQADVDTKGTGCPGFCERGPVVVIYPDEICYLQVTPEDNPCLPAAVIVFDSKQRLYGLVPVPAVVPPPDKFPAGRQRPAEREV